jgi:hypothetical protein
LTCCKACRKIEFDLLLADLALQFSNALGGLLASVARAEHSWTPSDSD